MFGGPTRLPSRTIVLIDDNADIRGITMLALERLGGHTVHAAASGEEGLRLARTVRPDVILLDVMMSGMDGYETLRWLKADPASGSIPVIFLTARTQDQERRRGLELGAAGFLTKPFDPLTLGDQIEEILAAR